MGRIDIEIGTSADNAALEATNQGLDDLQSHDDQASGATETLSGNLGALNGILGAIGVTISAGAILDLASQLDEAGAVANRTVDSFNTFTQGRADEYATRVQSAVNGLIDDEDALVVSQSLINNGFVSNSREAAELVRQATILGAAFSQIPAKEAAEDFAVLLNTLSPRQMKEFGLGIDEVRAKTQELMNANAELSEREATRQAVLELAATKAEKFSGVLDDQKAHIDAWGVAWADASEAIGKALAVMADPAIVRATQILNTMMDEQTQIATEGMGAWQGRLEIAQRVEAAQQAQRVATIDAVEAMRLERDVGLETAAAQERLATTTQMTAQETAAYNEALAFQESIQLRTLTNIDQLTTSHGGLAGVFETSQSLLSGYNLTQEQQLVMYEQLGLATGQVTLKQIEQADALRNLTNLYVNGNIDAQNYALALQNIKTGGDAAIVALTTLQKSVEDQGAAMGKSGDDLDKYVTSHLNAATNESKNVKQGLEEIQTEAAKVGQLKPEIQVKKEQVDAAIDSVAILQAGLLGLPTDITVHVNVLASGNGLPLVQGGGPETP